MSDRKEAAPPDVKWIRLGKKVGVLFGFSMAATVYLTGGSEYLVTVFVAVGCVCLDLPIVSLIRAIRGKANGA
jgi:hypothetical protein